MNYFFVGIIFLATAQLARVLLKGGVAKNIQMGANLIGAGLIAMGVIDQFIAMNDGRVAAAGTEGPFGGADIYEAKGAPDFDNLGGRTEKVAADAADAEVAGSATEATVPIDKREITANGIRANVEDAQFAPIDDSGATINSSLQTYEDIVASSVPNRANTNQF